MKNLMKILSHFGRKVFSMKEKLSAQEQIQQKDETVKKFVDKFKSDILEDWGLMVEKIYWGGWADGYQYKKLEEQVEKENSEK